jgi:hypothetical protein
VNSLISAILLPNDIELSRCAGFAMMPLPWNPH